MILGIDLGTKSTGIAASEGIFADPYKTITHKNQKEALSKVLQVVNELNAQTVVLGFVPGKIQKLFESFAQKLREENPNLQVVLWDETLTSGQARESMIKLQVPKTKRKEKEHAVAASIILQSYLDETKRGNQRI